MQLVPLISDSTFSTDSIASFIAESGNLMVLDSATNQYGVGRIFSNARLRLNGLNCSITGLALLRENRTLVHDGFSVTSGREIKIVVSSKTHVPWHSPNIPSM